jgi:exoribonuclease-2
MRDSEIVLVRYRRSLKIGILREVAAGKARIALDKTKSISVPRENILVTTGEIAHNQGELDRYSSDIETRARGVDLSEVWELLRDEKGPHRLESIADLYGSTELSTQERCALYIAVDAPENPYFQSADDDTYRAATVDEVESRLEKARRQITEREEDRAFLEWLSGRPSDRDMTMLSPRQRASLDRVIALVVEGDEWPQAPKVRTFLETHEAIKSTSRRGLFKMLVGRGVFTPDEHLELRRVRVPLEFSAESLARADEWEPARFVTELLSHPLSSDSAQLSRSRLDLRTIAVFSIDDETTTDIDDAFSVERLDGGAARVGIHITDLSIAIPPESALDAEARLRATSHYFPDRKIPMLPAAISERGASLVPNEDRPAVSLLVDVDATGTITASHWTLSVIRSRRRASYREVEALLGCESPQDDGSTDAVRSGDTEFRMDLETLERVASAQRQRRIEHGAVEIDRADLDVSVRDDGTVDVTLRASEPRAQSIVSELMILYNVAAARLASERGVPFLYRSQPALREESRRESEAIAHPVLRRHALLRAATPPDWLLEPRPHGFLGVEVYSQVSSPLRRSIDLILQRQLVAAITESPPCHSVDEIRARLYETEERLRELRHLEAGRRQYWVYTWFEARRTERFAAVVLEKSERHAFIELRELGLRGSANLPSHRAPGDEIEVRIGHVDPFEATIKFVED